MLLTAVIIVLMLASAAGGALVSGWRPTAPTAPASPSAVAHDRLADGILGLLDVDDMAGLNATHDFDTGDQLLDRLEDVLTRALPPELTITRLSNARFLLIFRGMDMAAAAATAERLRDLASRTYVDREAGIAGRTISAGLVRTFAHQDFDRAVLLADTVVSRAQANGGNRTEVDDRATPGVKPPVSQETLLAAIERGDLRYHLQPIVATETDAVVGMEALLRWVRQDAPAVPPAVFIDQVDRIPDEAADTFPEIAERATRPFRTEGADFFFNFNITGAVLDGADSASCRFLRGLLDRLPPDRLVLEVVESAVIARPERAHDLVTRLRERGARIALDDFGTGLSNLDRLRHFPVDFVKIDRALVAGLDGDARARIIVRHLVSMTRDLGIEIIAEGVETQAEATAVASIGIRYAQGFFYGRPEAPDLWAERLT
ncbi:GGDEF-domain containing protein [Jannaschia pagri]|uniref:GGDEF-domain containing protein n=1 Tax=Jannaschia pagri TaxID=2829797 RepID=A0ABQ4NIT4_9RHOB|nr:MULTISPECIES: bifunctional diguanylate cyclase/phosphodiesterase [unclassified Jannaschia]GIT89752.1 GGDEF-domain containing protein [Jannaschia sp. AI_61]GIT94140.1 GGDEF-domain containing protein [Jannaschia sp. AI_62]